MIKVGDYVQIKKYHKNTHWYNGEVYIIKKKHKNYNGMDVVILDRPYYTFGTESKKDIIEDYVEPAIKFTRFQKLKEIFNV